MERNVLLTVLSRVGQNSRVVLTHDVADYPTAQTLPGLIVYRYDAPLFFANVGDLRRRATMVVDQENKAFPQSPARWFILNVEANVEVDLTAADGLAELQRDLAERGVRLGLARVKQDLLLPLQRAGLMELIGTDMLFLSLIHISEPTRPY